MKIEIPHSVDKFERLGLGAIFYCNPFGEATRIAMKVAFHSDGSGPGIVYFTASHGIVPQIVDANQLGDLSTLLIPNVSIWASGSQENVREGISGIGALVVTGTGQKMLRCSEAGKPDFTHDVDLTTGKISRGTGARFSFIESVLFVPDLNGKHCELAKIKSTPLS